MEREARVHPGRAELEPTRREARGVSSPEARPEAARAREPWLWPVDWCHLVFLGGSTVLLILLRDVSPGAWAWVLGNLAFLGLLFAMAAATRRRGVRPAAFARMVFSLAVIPVVFTQLGSIVPHLNPAPWEQRLFHFDKALFLGVNPLEALERISNPWLTEVLQWVYDFYYFIAIIVGVAVLKRDRPLVLTRMNFVFVLCIYLSYVGYYIVPATGPNIDRYGLYQFEGALPGVWVATELRETLAIIEKIKQDCFPSGHTAVSVLALMLAWRYLRGLVPVLAPLVLALIFSTMYLRYHYVADVIAGLMLAVGSYHLGLWLHGRFERRQGGTHGDASGASG